MSISRILHTNLIRSHLKILVTTVTDRFCCSYMLRAGTVLRVVSNGVQDYYCSRYGAVINSAMIRIRVHNLVNLIYRV